VLKSSVAAAGWAAVIASASLARAAVAVSAVAVASSRTWAGRIAAAGFVGRFGEWRAFRVSHNEAAEAFSAAGGLDFVVGLEREVEHAAFSGTHRSKLVWLAGANDAGGGGLGSELEFAGAESLEVVGVEGDLVVLFGIEADDLGGDVFEGAKDFAAAFGDEFSIRAGELDVDFAGFEAVGVGRSAASGDAIFHAKSAGLHQRLKEGGNLMGGGGVVFDRHWFSFSRS